MPAAAAVDISLSWHLEGDEESASQPRRLNLERANYGFAERQKAVIALDQDPYELAKGREYRLLIDDEEIDPVGGAPNRWVWRPGFYAGEVRAELRDERKELGVWRLDVSPDEQKAGHDIFKNMLNDIVEFDASLVIGEEPARHRLGAVGETDNPLVLFERLRRRQEHLIASLEAIRAEPASVLRSRRRLVPFRAVRRADLRTVRAAIRQQETLAAVRGNAYEASGSRKPLFDVPAVERSFDSPANRAALFRLRELLLRCRDLRERIGVLACKRVGDTRTELHKRIPRWQEILDQLEKSLVAAERRQPFVEVRRPELTAAGLNAVAAHPLYARFWRLGWEALRRGVSGLQPEDALPITPTWEVYERWCFVALARMLRDCLGSDYKWRTSGSSDRRKFVGRSGDGQKITLFLQKTASSSNRAMRDGLWSVSRQCQPDLVLQWQRPGQEPTFAVLDAKYRSSRDWILRGMVESAHLYQDALRWGLHRSQFTLLLVPGVPTKQENWGWLTREDFVKEHRVGVVRLLPDVKPPGWFLDLLAGMPLTQAA